MVIGNIKLFLLTQWLIFIVSKANDYFLADYIVCHSDIICYLCTPKNKK